MVAAVREAPSSPLSTLVATCAPGMLSLACFVFFGSIVADAAALEDWGYAFTLGMIASLVLIFGVVSGVLALLWIAQARTWSVVVTGFDEDGARASVRYVIAPAEAMGLLESIRGERLTKERIAQRFGFAESPGTGMIVDAGIYRGEIRMGGSP